MDFQQPVVALIPGAHGKLLGVLASTTGELSIRTLARLADVSPAQASRVLPELERQGFIERHEVPPAVLFRLTPGHVATRLLRDFANARQRVIGEIGELAGRIDPPAVSVLLFGSFARGTADAKSDIDIMVIRSDAVDEDAGPWGDSIEAIRRSVELLSGNAVDLLEVTESRAVDALAAGTGLWQAIATEGIAVFGTDLASLRLRARRTVNGTASETTMSSHGP
jgi:predicted nucleotidyltransferase